MAYDWAGESNKTGRAPATTPGEHLLKIVRVIHSKQNGQAFMTRSNEPQMMVVYGDEACGECSEMMTLTAKAGWTLARMLSACGVNMERLQVDGLEPRDFVDPEFATTFLMPGGVGLKFKARVSYTKGNDGKDYPTIMPIRAQPK